MPELPEVETIKIYLSSKLIGKKIKNVTIFKPKMFIGDPKEIIRAKIIRLERRAKQLIIILDNGKYLLIHLKMSGQLFFESRIQNLEFRIKLPNKHTRIIIDFDDGSRLFFNDVRMFGWLKIIQNSEFRILNSKIGPEPLGKEFTVDYLEAIFAKSRKPIKQLLIEQDKIAGIGNIYANEALFEAGISPLKTAKQLTKKDIKILRYSILKILRKAIKYKGSSSADETYVQPTGEKGNYQKHFLVYQREGQPCRKCGGTIKRIKQSGRSTYFCMHCQK